MTQYYLGCKGEIDILVCKKWPSIYDLSLTVALLGKRLDQGIFQNRHWWGSSPPGPLPAPLLRKKCPTSDWGHLKLMTIEHEPKVHTAYKSNFIANLSLS